MNLKDLASLMKVSRAELIDKLKQNDVIELKLVEKSSISNKDEGEIKIIE